MSNKIMGVVAGIAILVIMVGSVLMPIINFAVDDSTEVRNNAATSLSSVVDRDLVLEIDGLDMSINGDAVNFGNSAAIFISDSFNLYKSSGSENVEFASKNQVNYIKISAVSVDISDSVATVAVTPLSGDPFTDSFVLGWGFVYDPNGEFGIYRLLNTSKTVAINSIDQIYGSNVLVTTSSWYSFHGNDLIIGDGQYTLDYGLTEINGFERGYNLSIGSTGNVTFTIDNNGEDYTVHPWIYVVPNEVTIFKEGTGSLSLLYVVPIFVIIAILLSCTVLFRRY